MKDFLCKRLNLFRPEALRRWASMTLYERFEQAIALCLTIVISFIIVFSLIYLVKDVVNVFIRDVNPLDHSVFQRVFGEILTVLIAMEFQHSIVRMVERTHGIIQVKTVLLIAILAIARKFIVLELRSVEPMVLVSMGVSILSLGLVYWLMRERDDRFRMLKTKAAPEEREKSPVQRFVERGRGAV